MTSADQDQRAARIHSAQLDLQDIRALEGFEPFQRFFMRKLRQRLEELDSKFRYLPNRQTTTLADKRRVSEIVVSHEEREILRRQLELLQEIMDFMATAKGSATNELERLA